MGLVCLCTKRRVQDTHVTGIQDPKLFYKHKLAHTISLWGEFNRVTFSKCINPLQGEPWAPKSPRCLGKYEPLSPTGVKASWPRSAGKPVTQPGGTPQQSASQPIALTTDQNNQPTWKAALRSSWWSKLQNQLLHTQRSCPARKTSTD